MDPALGGLAEYMADCFSRDPTYWPRGAPAAGLPIPVSFRWFGAITPAVGSELMAQLVEVLREPYRSEEESSAALPVHVASANDADSVIVLADVYQDGKPGVGYEIQFACTTDVWPGWFALPRA